MRSCAEMFQIQGHGSPGPLFNLPHSEILGTPMRELTTYQLDMEF